MFKKIAIIEKEIKSWVDLKKVHDDLEILVEFKHGEIELNELSKELDSYVIKIEDLELKLTLGNSADSKNAIISIHRRWRNRKSRLGADVVQCIRDGLRWKFFC